MDWVTIINVVWMVLTVVLPAGALAVILKVLKAIKETSDVGTTVYKAWEDQNITQEEMDAIIKEINEAKGAWADVFAGKRGAA
jgi:multidrug efflux pump subunit AcrB